MVCDMPNKQITDTTDDLVLPRVAAKMLHVETRTLQRMAERGEVKAIRLPSGHRRYELSSIKAILATAEASS